MAGAIRVPSPFDPWQLAQCSSYSGRPASTCAEAEATGLGTWARAPGRNTNAPGSARTPSTIRYTLANRGRLTSLRQPRSSDHEDRREDAHPHDVDEVPVV